jgi:hypothetical protein
MKKLLSFALALSGLNSFAQVYADLDINNIKARLNPAGDLFWDFSNAKFEAPKGSGINTIFTGNLWIGGYDAGSQLHMAAQTYRQSGTDFWTGPLDTTTADIQSSVSNSTQWNRVWKINKSTIDSFKLGLFTQTPSSITNWPGNGNAINNQAHLLAPYFDNDGNGNYNPSGGDYPVIRGDQAVYFIYNDHEQGMLHLEAKGGLPLGVEVHGMAYAFKNTSDSALNNAIFIQYRMINRSQNQYNNCYVAMWCDLDIGYYGDDYVGCDVTRQSFFGYNADAVDGTGSPGEYGNDLGAQAVVFLNGITADALNGKDDDKDCIVDNVCESALMSSFHFYNNDASMIGNPDSARHFYQYMTARWKDNTPVTYGGDGYNTGQPCNYMYPGSSDLAYGWGLGGNCAGPVSSIPWDEFSAGNTGGDRRGVGSSGPFTFKPGDVQTLDLAYVFGRDYTGGGVQPSLNVMNARIDSIRSYVAQSHNPCGGIFNTGILENKTELHSILVYPNPANHILFLSFSAKTKNAVCEVYDVTGKKVLSVVGSQLLEGKIDVSGFANGLYMIRIVDGDKVYSQKFLKE